MNNSPLMALITIVKHGKGESVVEFLQKCDVECTVITQGRGTATEFWSDLLGLGESKSDVTLSFVNGEVASDMLFKLNEQFGLAEKNTGIAFTVDVNSFSSRTLYNYLANSEVK